MLPVYHNLLAALRVFRGSVAPTQVLRTRGKQLNLRKVSVDDRQILNVCLVKSRRHVRAVGLKLWRFGRHFY